MEAKIVEEKVQIIEADGTCPALPLVEGEGSAQAVIWPGVGAQLRSMHLIDLRPGARTIEQRHPMEAVYYVVEGSARAVDTSDGSSYRVSQGVMIFVEPDTPYEIHADDGVVRLVGGPCPPDPALYRQLVT